MEKPMCTLLFVLDFGSYLACTCPVNFYSKAIYTQPLIICPQYGGGRTIRPGEVLETAEVQAAKDARTRELVAAYRRKRDSSVDPELKSECEEV